MKTSEKIIALGRNRAIDPPGDECSPEDFLMNYAHLSYSDPHKMLEYMDEIIDAVDTMTIVDVALNLRARAQRVIKELELKGKSETRVEIVSRIFKSGEDIPI